LGGFIGSASRYALGLALLHRSTLITFPLATLLVNFTGSFLIGLLAGNGATRDWLGADIRVFLLVGILGGFTTFSSFSYDTLHLWRESGALRAALNVTLNVGLCLLAVWLGDVAGRLNAG
jgi:CrcB protein